MRLPRMTRKAMINATSSPTTAATGSSTRIDVMPSLVASKRATVAGHAEEQRLAEAQDSGVAPDQVEGQRQQPEDEHAGGEQDPELVHQQRQDQRNAPSSTRLDPGDHAALLASALGGELTSVRRRGTA